VGEPRVARKILEQLLSDVTAHESSPFRAAPLAGESSDRKPAVDVSSAAMGRLRTPFGVEGDTDAKATAPVRGQ
jgi:hypothetical protein